MMIDTIVLYIFIQVLLTLSLIQGRRIARKHKLLHQLSQKASSQFEWKLVTVVTC